MAKGKQRRDITVSFRPISPYAGWRITHGLPEARAEALERLGATERRDTSTHGEMRHCFWHNI